MPSSWMIASSGALPNGRADDGRTNTMNARKRPIGSLRRNLAAIAASCTLAALLWPAGGRAADTDPCDSLMPAAIGGPLLPATSETAVFRWLANANYELDYRGQVFLFDTYYNRKARNRGVGFTAAQVNRASVI